MKLDITHQMRLEQRMKLAPRMIQSMEILQLPAMALEERIEAELNNNPVLEIDEPVEQTVAESDVQSEQDSAIERPIIVRQDRSKIEDFERLDDFARDADDYLFRSEVPTARSTDEDEADRKLEAIVNTPDRGLSLHEYLTEQWRLVDADEKVKKAGQAIIDYIDERGYLKVRLEQLCSQDSGLEMKHFEEALKLVQQLEPVGVGARDIRECLLLQMAQYPEDMSFEMEIVSKYFDKLLENKLPEIAKKMGCSVDRIKEAIARMRRFDTSPGLAVSRVQNPPVKADVIVEPSEEGGFKVYLADSNIPNLRINEYYAQMVKDRRIDARTREFLKNNIRSAKWLMDAIEQRKQTLLKVSQAIVEHQKEFFEKGKMYLKPLPMSRIAEAVGVHIATVSRAVAGKYIQSPQGIMPMRELFSGGVETDEGSESFEAIRAKIQQIIDGEDKSRPLSDEAIRKKLEQMGVKNIARRTIAKYRKIMKIPAARFRKRF